MPITGDHGHGSREAQASNNNIAAGTAAHSAILRPSLGRNIIVVGAAVTPGAGLTTVSTPAAACRAAARPRLQSRSCVWRC